MSRNFARVGVVASAVLLALAGYWLLAPTIEQLLMPVSNDHCPRLTSGEPDRGDPDCYGSWGVNYVDEWDRLHPSP